MSEIRKWLASLELERYADVFEREELTIANLGTLVLKDTPPRRYHNVRVRQVMEAPGYKVMRLFLAKSR